METNSDGNVTMARSWGIGAATDLGSTTLAGSWVGHCLAFIDYITAVITS